MIADVEACLREADEGLPLFLYGHSMGGLVVLSTASRNPHINFAGIISSSAFLGINACGRKMDFAKSFVLRKFGGPLGVININIIKGFYW